MKKVLFSLTLLFVAGVCLAQNTATFKLTTFGSFASEEGKDYVVIPFEGKNAHQIFLLLCANVNKLYKNPQKVMSVVDDASVSIRAYDSKITYIKDLIQSFNVGGYYNLNFEIKDGRVKVSAPIIDEDLTRTANGAREKDFSRMVKSWAKDGVFKDKFAKQVDYTETNINSIINAILGAGKANEEEEW